LLWRWLSELLRLVAPLASSARVDALTAIDLAGEHKRCECEV